jgi:hypothetical protein
VTPHIVLMLRLCGVALLLQLLLQLHNNTLELVDFYGMDSVFVPETDRAGMVLFQRLTERECNSWRTCLGLETMYGWRFELVILPRRIRNVRQYLCLLCFYFCLRRPAWKDMVIGWCILEAGQSFCVRLLLLYSQPTPTEFAVLYYLAELVVHGRLGSAIPAGFCRLGLVVAMTNLRLRRFHMRTVRGCCLLSFCSAFAVSGNLGLGLLALIQPSFGPKFDYTGVPDTVVRSEDGTAKVEWTHGDGNCGIHSVAGELTTEHGFFRRDANIFLLNAFGSSAATFRAGVKDAGLCVELIDLLWVEVVKPWASFDAGVSFSAPEGNREGERDTETG